MIRKIERYGVLVVNPVPEQGLCIKYVYDVDYEGVPHYSHFNQPIAMEKKYAEQMAVHLVCKGVNAFVFEMPDYWDGNYPQLQRKGSDRGTMVK